MAAHVILGVDVDGAHSQVALGPPEGPFDGREALVGGHSDIRLDVFHPIPSKRLRSSMAAELMLVSPIVIRLLDRPPVGFAADPVADHRLAESILSSVCSVAARSSARDLQATLLAQPRVPADHVPLARYVRYC